MAEEKHIDESRKRGDGLRVTGDGLRVTGYRENQQEAAPTITLSQPESASRKPIEAEDIESASLRVEDSEKELIRRALELTKGNRKEAAVRLGVSERTLYRKIKEYGL